MSASSLYTAAAAAVCNRLLSAYTHNQYSFCFPSKAGIPKLFFNLKIRNPISLPTFPPLSHLPNSRRCSTGFDSFESTGDVEQAGENPEAEDPFEGEKEEKGTQSNVEEGRLYVGNLPYAMTASEVEQVFRQAGNVINVQIVYDRVTDRSRGFAFVTMGSNEEAKEAIRIFNGSQIGGRTMKVNFPEVPWGGEKEVIGPNIRNSYRSFIETPHKIYAGNLGWGLTSQALRDAFAHQPGLVSAKVIYDRDSGRSRGFGFVTFESVEDVQSALQAMNGVEVEGRPLRLNLAAERALGSRPGVVKRVAEENFDSSDMVSTIET